MYGRVDPWDSRANNWSPPTADEVAKCYQILLVVGRPTRLDYVSDASLARRYMEARSIADLDEHEWPIGRYLEWADREVMATRLALLIEKDVREALREKLGSHSNPSNDEVKK